MLLSNSSIEVRKERYKVVSNNLEILKNKLLADNGKLSDGQRKYFGIIETELENELKDIEKQEQLNKKK